MFSTKLYKDIFKANANADLVLPNSCRTSIVFSPSNREIRSEEINTVVVNSYSFSSAKQIQDIGFLVRNTTLVVILITIRPGILIGKNGEELTKAVSSLEKEFVNEKWGFKSVAINIIENTFNSSDLHFDGGL